jgi:hypothetical protein
MKITIELQETNDKELLTKTAQFLLALADHEMVMAKPRVPGALKSEVTEATPDLSVFTDHLSKTDDMPLTESDANSDRDSVGIQWNIELHTRTKSRNADGTWKMKRTLESQPQSPQPTAAQIFAKPAAPVVPAPPAPEPQLTFPVLVGKITKLIQDMRLTQEQVIQAVQFVGLNSLYEVAASPHLLAAINDRIDQIIGDTQ